jgi:hypothetical protein
MNRDTLLLKIMCEEFSGIFAGELVPRVRVGDDEVDGQAKLRERRGDFDAERPAADDGDASA